VLLKLEKLITFPLYIYVSNNIYSNQELYNAGVLMILEDSFKLFALFLLVVVGVVGADDNITKQCNEYTRKVMAKVAHGGRATLLEDSIMRACAEARLLPKGSSKFELHAHDPKKSSQIAYDEAWFASMSCGSTPPEAFLDGIHAYIESRKK
jgi:hypothetical protein